MIRRMTGIALIVLGDVFLIVCLTADPLGLGAAPQAIGYKQISGAIASIIVQLAGIVLSQVEVRSKSWTS